MTTELLSAFGAFAILFSYACGHIMGYSRARKHYLRMMNFERKRTVNAMFGKFATPVATSPSCTSTQKQYLHEPSPHARRVEK